MAIPIVCSGVHSAMAQKGRRGYPDSNFAHLQANQVVHECFRAHDRADLNEYEECEGGKF
jgi:hypothetical protein